MYAEHLKQSDAKLIDLLRIRSNGFKEGKIVNRRCCRGEIVSRIRHMTIGNRVAILRYKFAQSIGFPFAEILCESEIEQTLEDEGVTYRKRLF